MGMQPVNTDRLESQTANPLYGSNRERKKTRTGGCVSNHCFH